MSKITVVERSDKDAYTSDVNNLLSEGYKILSTSCGFVNDPSYSFCTSYQAILILEDENKEEVHWSEL